MGRENNGKDVTIVSSLLMMHFSMLSADMLSKEGIDCEIIDPRTLWPLDIDLIINSVKKTGRIVIVEESSKQGGIGAEIAAQVSEKVIDYLLAPVIRIAAPNTPAPFAPVLEKFYIPQPERITETIRGMVSI
ncbi:MAG: hypothetical protein M1308_04775 [Actinobacteria bacterium]|nr:hypothetical protein [Actinomycetota bacterium]